MRTSRWRVALVMVWLFIGEANTQNESSATEELSYRPTEVWRWHDSTRQPFHSWHTDPLIQSRIYNEASKHVHEATGVMLTSNILVAIVPSSAFSLATTEMGARDGSIYFYSGISRAMENLCLGSKWMPRSQSDNGGHVGHPGSALSFAGGIYVPKHVKQMIWLSPDRDEAQVLAILSHELVHALQDHHFPFKKFFSVENLTADEILARQAIEEGYALLVAGKLDASAVKRCIQSGISDGNLHLFRLLNEAGIRCAGHMNIRAASPMELLDLLFQHPPTTTQAVVHPELYDSYLDSGMKLSLPEPEEFRLLEEMCGSALGGSGKPVVWRSRMGEIALQTVLVELGMPLEEVMSMASLWRNDSVTNFGESQSPDTTASVWALADAVGAEALYQKMRDRMDAHGWVLQAVDMPSISARGCLTSEDASNPPVLLIRSGSALAFVVGNGVDALVAGKGR